MASEHMYKMSLNILQKTQRTVMIEVETSYKSRYNEQQLVEHIQDILQVKAGFVACIIYTLYSNMYLCFSS